MKEPATRLFLNQSSAVLRTAFLRSTGASLFSTKDFNTSVGQERPLSGTLSLFLLSSITDKNVCLGIQTVILPVGPH